MVKPFSKEPSPKVEKGTSVKVAYAPNCQPLLNVLLREMVDPRSPARYFPASIFTIQSFGRS